jgi:hypothetical protein
VQQVCHRESDQYWQCCPPDLHGCGAAFWTPYQNPETIKSDDVAVAAQNSTIKMSKMACTGSSSGLNAVSCAAWQDFAKATNIAGWTQCSGALLDPCSCVIEKGGVICADGDITSMLLFENKLKGTIPRSLAALTRLDTLDLSLNALTGFVPPLPFKQYSNGCALNDSGCTEDGDHDCNHFRCPLPAGSKQCNWGGDAGIQCKW